MHSHDALDRFHEFAARRGVVMEQLAAAEAIDLMAAFYREVRADDCDLDAHGDMLLFQWGVYNRWQVAEEGDVFDIKRQGEFFEYDITRQLIPVPEGPEEDSDDFIGQLSLTLTFRPTAALRRIEAGNRWCPHPAELEDFLAFVRGSEATVAVSGLNPEAISATFENAE